MLWTEKYRPQRLDDLVGNEYLQKTLKRFLDHKQLPHLIFYGPPGLGKTSVARALIKEMYGNETSLGHFIELNASDERSIKFVRENITDFISKPCLPLSTAGDQTNRSNHDPTPPRCLADQSKILANESAPKIVILEEVDRLSNDAQFCLRRLMEIHASHARFCMTCNDVRRLIPAIRSRCCEFKFRPLQTEDMLLHLKRIIINEHISIDDDAIKALVEFSEGDMRKSVSSLQVLYDGDKHITLDDVVRDLTHCDRNGVSDLIHELSGLSHRAAFCKLEQFIKMKDIDLQNLLKYVHDVLRTRESVNNKSLRHWSILLADIEEAHMRRASLTTCLGALSHALSRLNKRVVSA